MCGILGISSDKDDISVKMYEGLTYLQHRGQDSAGIANESLCIKSPGLVKSVFDEDKLKELKSTMCVGHVRYSTTGTFDKSCIQPLESIYKGKNIYLCHNGNIINIDDIKKIIGNVEYTSDSKYLLELFIYKLNEYETLTSKVICNVCEFIIKNVKGSYSVLILIENFGMIAFRDFYGIRPLAYGILKNNYIISSESNVINALEQQFIRDVNPGEIIVFEKNKMPIFYHNVKGVLSPCLFEYIYFSRIDSVIDGICVYDARYRLGFLLGEKIKRLEIKDIDVIVPVPDSSLIFALGLQESLNIKINYGLVKNPYIDRTFIMKDDKIINKSIKRKLNVITSVLEGKNILIVDDSIVRGNTSSHIVYLAKKAGAKNIYMASGAPPILYPNKYGIFIESQKELIAVNRTEKDIADIIGATSVIYNDLYAVIDCLKKINPNINGFEISMFNNQHLFKKIDI